MLSCSGITAHHGSVWDRQSCTNHTLKYFWTWAGDEEETCLEHSDRHCLGGYESGGQASQVCQPPDIALLQLQHTPLQGSASLHAPQTTQVTPACPCSVFHSSLEWTFPGGHATFFKQTSMHTTRQEKQLNLTPGLDPSQRKELRLYQGTRRGCACLKWSQRQNCSVMRWPLTARTRAASRCA